MKTSHAILTTTHVDRHGDRMTLAALEHALDEINNRKWIPLTYEHDPRIPPFGRVVRAQIRQLNDGEYGLEGELEIFEPGDELPLADEDRELAAFSMEPNGLKILFDRQFLSTEDQLDIAEIARLLEVSPEQEFKKSIDPIAVLTICACFIASQIATGFLNRLGEEGYNRFRSRLKSIISRRIKLQAETLFRLVLIVQESDRNVQVEIIASQPTELEIDQIFTKQTGVLDSVLPSLIADQSLRRLVLEFKDNRLIVCFGVRKDAVTLYPRINTQQEESNQ
jgi:hypothetical protein